MHVGLFQPTIERSEMARVVSSEMLYNDRDGNTYNLADLKGKVIFINFWATWCPPCIAEMPSINALYNIHKGKDEVVFLTIDADNDIENSSGFMEKRKLTLPVYTPAGTIPQQFFTGTLPTTVIINKNGELVYKHEGAADYASEKMKGFLEELMTTP